MKKKKKKSILLSPNEYWEDILNFNFTTEFARYKILCGFQGKNVVIATDGVNYITHAEWKEHIIKVFSVLPKNRLQELRFYLRNEKRNTALIDTSNGTTFIPLILAMISIVISQLMDIYIKTTAATNIGITGVTIALFSAISKKIYNMMRDDRYKHLFYEDLEEIAKELLQNS